MGVPLTSLSGSLMPRAMPFILPEMKISDMPLVHEIRRYTGRLNLKSIIKDQLVSSDEIQTRSLSAIGIGEDDGGKSRNCLRVYFGTSTGNE
jgi:hypothetical protein